MSYILIKQNNKNDTQYVQVSSTGGTVIVKEISKATVFKTREKAEERKRHSPKRLKNYKIVECDEDEEKHTEILTPAKRKSFSASERDFVYNRAEGHCEICGHFVPYNEFTLDHIIPLAKGGENDLNNLQCACRFCNQLKDNMDYNIFTEKAATIVLKRAESDTVFREELCHVLKKKKRIQKRIRNH